MRPGSQSSNVVQALQEASMTGQLPGRGLQPYLKHRLCSLALSRHISVSTSQLGGLRWMDLDAVEQRYLITAAADSTIEAFDVVSADDRGRDESQELLPLFTLKRSHPAAHRYQVTSVVWYPVDTGLFVSGSADQDVKVWDTNTLQMACCFSCPDKVLSVAMSGCATSHALIAVGDRKPGLVLADIVSGAFTHTLDGHRSGTWSICWSPSCQYQLFSGDGSGCVRLWDIRRSGCRALLDMNMTENPPKPQPAAAPAAAAAGSAAATGCSRRKRRQDDGLGPRRLRLRVAAGAEGGGEDDDEFHGVAGMGRRGAGSTGGAQYAHEGPVTCIHATQDNRSLVTAGIDHRVRLWDAGHLHHLLVHYSDTFNRGAFPKRLSSTPDGRVLFNPRGNDIQVFDIHTGQQLALLSQGHYDTVTACIYSPKTGHLWTSGLDGAVLAWEPWTHPQNDTQPETAHHMDWWLAAAAAGRGRQQQQQPELLPGSGGSAAAGSGSRGVLTRAVLPDIDYWSDDEELLVGS